MSAARPGYTRTELVAGLRRVGLEPGDTVFVHASLDGLGPLDDSATPEDTAAAVLDALIQVIGGEGTLLVPTYTFSFCRGEPFDPRSTPTEGGPWSSSAEFLEHVRTRPGAARSRDPIHSVAGLGPEAARLLDRVAPTCFGEDSVFDRLRRAGGKICMLGVGLYEASFQHHVEEMVGVPFRYRKLFTGQMVEEGLLRKAGWLYNVRILAENSVPDDSRMEELARRSGVCLAATVGAGEVLAVESDRYYDLVRRELARDPWITARGPAGDPLELERRRVGGPSHAVTLPRLATMEQMIERLWQLPRDIVSDGYDAALAALATQVPMTVHEYPTGTECFTWMVPEKWTCHEAYLETLDGRRLFSYADHPLHVMSYSLPFEGEVAREELLRHLHVHHQLEDAIPFAFKYYERDWGLCCSRRVRDSLADDHYRVVIRTSFSYGTLKVGEVVIPGETDESIVLCAHLCHPCMVNDDLTGVVVGIDVARTLLARERRRYTYRLLILPETIGSVAWLSRNEGLIPRLKGGLFLEMLGVAQPHALQRSFEGAGEIDQCFRLALAEHDPLGWVGDFPRVIGNDERQFNAPGVRVPMLSLSRVLPPDAAAWPYLGYHSSFDRPELISTRQLEESRDLVLRMLDTLEANVVPVNRFRGEVFCSRYGIHPDFWAEPEAHRALFDIMYLIDGTRTVAQIAEACGTTFRAVRATLDELRRHGLVADSVPSTGGRAEPRVAPEAAPASEPRSRLTAASLAPGAGG